MTAWAVHEPGPVGGGPLRQVTIPVPQPGPGEILVQVDVCRLPNGPAPRGGRSRTQGARHRSRPRSRRSGRCRGRRRHRLRARSVGRHRMVAVDLRPMPLPPTRRREPSACRRATRGGCARRLCRVCGGARRVRVPAPGRLHGRRTGAAALCRDHRLSGAAALGTAPRGRLGVYGFGASAHLATQVALAEGATVHVLTRAAAARELALSLGASSAAGADDAPPEPWTPLSCSPPSASLVPVALRRSTRAGRSR